LVLNLERLQYGYPSHIQNINYKSKRREFTMQNALLFTLPFSYPFFFLIWLFLAKLLAKLFGKSYIN
jgi:hypothetical protein